MNIFDAYYKKDVTYNYRDKNLKFHVSQALFSSQGIDAGTRHLLRTLETEGFNRFSKVLDLGCGYGPIGISLKSFYKPSVIHMVDRDALALEFSRKNVQLNHLSGIKIYPSLGYDNVTETDFDLIVSNIPSKVGEPVLSHILEDAGFYLRPDGKAAIVVIKAISNYVSQVLQSNKNIKILFAKKWPEYFVFHYEFTGGKSRQPELNAFERSLYRRGRQKMLINHSEVSIETAYGLAEFDTLSYETEMILEQLKTISGQKINKAVIFNPNQGIIPVALAKTAIINRIDLIGRDLEALKISAKNLTANGFNPEKTFLFHQAGLTTAAKDPADLMAGILDDKDNPKVHLMLIKEAHDQILPGGLLILACDSTPITRTELLVKKAKLFKVIGRKKLKRKSSIILQRIN